MSPLRVYFSSGISHSSKHESYTDDAIYGAQDCLVESQRGEEIRAGSAVNMIHWFTFATLNDWKTQDTILVRYHTEWRFHNFKVLKKA